MTDELSCAAGGFLLTREGLTKDERLLAALDPGYVQLDDRKVEDLLYFAWQYAGRIAYQDNNALSFQGIEHEDFRQFFEEDISFLTAIYTAINPAAFKALFADIDALAQKPGSTQAEWRNVVYTLFQVAFSLASRIDTWYRQCGEGFRLHRELEKMILFQLKEPLAALFFAFSRVRKAGLDTGFLLGGTYWEYLVPCRDFTEKTFLEKWIVWPGCTSWMDYVENLEKKPLAEFPDDAFPEKEKFKKLAEMLQDNTIPEMEKLKNLTAWVREPVNIFYGNLLLLTKQAPLFMEETLAAYPFHTPHLALYLAFVKLFGYHQAELNRLPQRHLDFYYQDVLQFTKHKAVPPRVHIYCELARQAASAFLQKGTLLKAGKDGTGKEVFYETTRDVTVNKAMVSAIYSLFVDIGKTGEKSGEEGGNIESKEGSWHVYLKKQELRAETAWPPFGVREAQFLPAGMQDAETGFAVSSRLLFLKEGERTITLEFTLAETSDLDAKAAKAALPTGSLEALLSSEKDWIITTPTVEEEPSNNLKLKIELTAADLPVTAYSPELTGYTFNSALPVLVIRSRKDVKTQSAYAVYGVLKKLLVSQFHLEVEVNNITSLVAQNDQGLIDPAKPFAPFGHAPETGTALLIGQQEMFTKPLTQATLDITWMNVPRDFSTIYNVNDYSLTQDSSIELSDSVLKFISRKSGTVQDFPGEIAACIKEFISKESGAVQDLPDKIAALIMKFISKESGTTQDPLIQKYGLTHDLSINDFKVGIDVLSSREWQACIHTGNSALFPLFGASGTGWNVPDPGENADKECSYTMKFNEETEAADNTSFRPLDKPFNKYEPGLANGFMRLVLKKPDIAFGHKLYRELYPQQLIQVFNKKRTAVLKEPYTPLVKAIRLSYTARERLVTGKAQTQFFHLYPLGYTEKTINENEEFGLVPLFTNNAENNMPSNGELYLGITAFKSGDLLSLLFQLDEGSANPGMELKAVAWSYLKANTWHALDSTALLLDTTGGLIRSGIIRFRLPADITADNTIMPAGYIWLKASVTGNTDAVCSFQGVHAQAVEAVFKDNRNDPAYPGTIAKPGTIQALKESNSAFKKIHQPYSAFGGSPEEGDTLFYTRCSERLRHKARAVSVHDYERLILGAFPGIYKVKCIPHSRYHNPGNGIWVADSEFAPGFTTLIVVPYIHTTADTLKPRVSFSMLQEIKKFLVNKTSPFLENSLDVLNPQYEPVRIECRVVFKADCQAAAGFYRLKLNQDLVAFLSPWVSGKQDALNFSLRIHSSHIIYFIEKLGYVDYLEDFILYKEKDQETGKGKFVPVEEVFSSHACSILVSAEEHSINKEPVV